MKCPHCDKEMELELGSPMALYLHLRKSLKVAKKHPGAEKGRAHIVKKYQAWVNWVEKMMKEEG